MNPQITRNQTASTADEATIRAFHHQMIAAWNQGSGKGLAERGSETADFITFEGAHLKGRNEIAAFHQQAFYTALKRTCLEGEINFVHFLNPQLALMHAVTRVGCPDKRKLHRHEIRCSYSL